MKKFLIMCLVLIIAGWAASALTYDAANYLDNKSYIGSGNKTLDPVYLNMNEVETVIEATQAVITTTTTPVTVTAASTGGTYVSYGVAAGAADCIFNLPTAVAGLTYTFADANATIGDDLWVTAAAGDKINGGTAAKSFKNTGDVYGAGVTLIAIDATNWVAIPGAIGTWANDNN